MFFLPFEGVYVSASAETKGVHRNSIYKRVQEELRNDSLTALPLINT